MITAISVGLLCLAAGVYIGMLATGLRRPAPAEVEMGKPFLLTDRGTKATMILTAIHVDVGSPHARISIEGVDQASFEREHRA